MEEQMEKAILTISLVSYLLLLITIGVKKYYPTYRMRNSESVHEYFNLKWLYFELRIRRFIRILEIIIWICLGTVFILSLWY